MSATFQDDWPRWRQLTSTAAHRGVLCFGPNKGRNVTYTSPQRWLPGFRPEPGESAIRALVKRYLHAYGPATPEHFARWLGVPPRAAAGLFAAMADELEAVEVDGLGAWTAAGDTEPPAEPPSGVRLLPYFDAFVVAGVWRQERSGRRLAVTVEPLGSLSAAQRRELEAEVELIGAILEAARGSRSGR